MWGFEWLLLCSLKGKIAGLLRVNYLSNSNQKAALGCLLVFNLHKSKLIHLVNISTGYFYPYKIAQGANKMSIKD
jgi:hypothetical protein